MLHEQLAWYLAGPVLGLGVVACRVLFNGRLGVTGGYSELITKIGSGSLRFDWRGWFAIGVLLGGVIFVAAWGGPDFHGYGWLTRTFHGAERIWIAPSYLFLFFASAVLTAAAGLELVRRRERRALLTDAPIEVIPEKPERRHVTGALLFGVGWGVADACPAPIATQIGQGIGWAGFTLAGVVLGVWLFQRRGAAETEPSADRSSRRAAVRRPFAAEAARARGS